MKSLFYQFNAPFELALQGYAVVAPDFAGLGVTETSRGKPIPHQYLANQAAANDLVYAVEAARKAFPSTISKEFVIMGHSQGGGAAWAAANRLATHPMTGYLGTIAGSPTTSFSKSTQFLRDPVGQGPLIVSLGLASIFPTFKPEDWLTSGGVARAKLARNIQACISTIAEISSLGINAQSNFTETWYFKSFDKLTSVFGKKIAGPMLVLQGTGDPVVNVTITNEAVDSVCKVQKHARLQYATFENVSHVPVLYASRRIWLDWIADRFSGISLPRECSTTHYAPALSSMVYQPNGGYFLQYPLYRYEMT